MSARNDELAAVLAELAPVIGVSDIISLPSAMNEQARGVLRLQVPDFAARTWRIVLGPPQVTGATIVPLNGTWPPSMRDQPNVDWGRNSTIARVRWGFGSVQQSVDIDWRSGCTFAVHASNVEVDVLMPNGVASLTPGAQASVRFRASAVPADAVPGLPSGYGPTISQDTGSIVGPAIAYFQVPRFARTLRFNPYIGAISNSWAFSFYPTTAVANLIGYYAHGNASGRIWSAWDVNSPIPVPANARVVGVQPVNVGAQAGILEWGLDFA